MNQETVLLEKNYWKWKSKFNNEKKEKGKGQQLLTPEQMLQRLPIALAQVKAGKMLLNEIQQIICSLYWAKKTL